MTQHDIEKIKLDAIKYLETQITRISITTISKRIGVNRKVASYVLRNNPDVFKRHVYAL